MALLPGVPEEPVLDRILPETPVFDEAFWVATAEGAIRDYCQWHIAPIRESVFVVEGGGAKRVLIPTLRIRELKLVTVEGRDVTSRVTPAEPGVLELDSGFTGGLSSVVVRAVHGYAPEEVPAVMGVIASAAARFADSLGNIVQSQTAGGSTVAFFAGSESLLAAERAKLDPYRLRGRT